MISNVVAIIAFNKFKNEFLDANAGVIFQNAVNFLGEIKVAQ